MKIILLGIACILFGFTSFASVAFGIAGGDAETIFTVTGFAFSLLGIVLAFLGAIIKDNK